MSTTFIGIYKALYDYQATNQEELDIVENDILYLLEKSDVDDWWKVKKRVLDANVEEPVGLVPSNYITPADVKSQVKALYDYDRQTDEELSFQEGQIFDLFDDSDENWLLVGLNNQQFGFIPSNFTEPMVAAATTATNAISSSTYGSTSAVNSFPPPPQRNDLKAAETQSQPQEEPPLPSMPTRPQASQSYNDNYSDDGYGQEEDDEAPPPMPSRPKASSSNSNSTSNSRSRARTNSFTPPPSSSQDKEFYHDDLFTWPVYEIDGRRKRKCSLSIGNSRIFIKNLENEVSKDWPISDLMNYNSEKKYVFLEVRDPYKSYEFHAGSKDAAEAIISILGDLKGMNSMNALKEIQIASQPTGGKDSSSKKQGKILYDFEAASSDELTVHEGDTVIIINDKKSKEWWMVQNVSTGKTGVIPSNYIKLVSSSGFKSLFSRKGSNLSLNNSSPTKKQSKKDLKEQREREVLENKQRELQRQHEEIERQKRKMSQRERELRDREERDRIRRADEKERLRREQKSKANGSSSNGSSSANGSSSHGDPSKPNPHRVRTWIDRSGSFKVEAEFLGCSDGKIHLHKVNGVKIAVAAPKLSSEDLEYVERITGMSLDNYKPKKQERSKSDHYSSPSPTPAAAPPAQYSAPVTSVVKESKPASSSSTSLDQPYNSKLHEYWFDFFVSCGVDANVCERYAKNFTKEEMDESILQDVSPSLLRTLGLREGDILRVNKFLDAKFNRNPAPAASASTSENGGLFTGADGAIKNNKTGSQPQFEDDAWVVKPANATTSTTPAPAPQTATPAATSLAPQITGSIQDLINIKPAESKPTSTGGSSLLLKPVSTSSTIPSMTAQKTASTTMSSQQTGALFPMPTGFMPITMVPALTGALTGGVRPGLLPFQTGGNLAPALTGGLMALQKTGGLQPMPTTSFGMGAPMLTGGLMPLQRTGGLQPMPTTSFGMGAPMLTGGLMPLQKTGGLQPMPTTSFGMGAPMLTGAPMPMMTGGVMPLQKTGGFQPIPTTSFGAAPNFQPTMPTTSFGATPGFQPSMPTTSFGGMGGMPMGQPTGGFPAMQPTQTGYGMMPQVTNMMGGMNLGMNPTGFQPQQQQPQQMPPQQQPAFGMNGMNGMNMQQPQQPLMSQPTGLGFGNAPATSFGGFGGQVQQPLMGQPTGKRANLANATADNPFGF